MKLPKSDNHAPKGATKPRALRRANRCSRSRGNAFSASAPDIPAACRCRLATLAAENAALRDMLAETETLLLALERAISRAEILKNLHHADAPAPSAN